MKWKHIFANATSLVSSSSTSSDKPSATGSSSHLQAILVQVCERLEEIASQYAQLANPNAGTLAPSPAGAAAESSRDGASTSGASTGAGGGSKGGPAAGVTGKRRASASASESESKTKWFVPAPPPDDSPGNGAAAAPAALFTGGAGGSGGASEAARKASLQQQQQQQQSPGMAAIPEAQTAPPAQRMPMVRQQNLVSASACLMCPDGTVLVQTDAAWVNQRDVLTIVNDLKTATTNLGLALDEGDCRSIHLLGVSNVLSCYEVYENFVIVNARMDPSLLAAFDTSVVENRIEPTLLEVKSLLNRV